MNLPSKISTQTQFEVEFEQGKNKKVIPDITIYSESGITLIEVKVNSGLNQYNRKNDSVDQIELYNMITGVDRVFALSKYSIISPALKQKDQIYWSDVFDILSESDNEVARSFTTFLREHGMDSVKPIQKHSEKTVSLCKSILTQIERSWSDSEFSLYEDLTRDWIGFKIKKGKNFVGWIGQLLEKENYIIIESIDPSVTRKCLKKLNSDPEYDENDNLIIAQLEIAKLIELKSANEQKRMLGQWINDNIRFMK